MVMSLHPRLAARDFESSVVIMVVTAWSPGEERPGEATASPGRIRSY